jgi:glycosyltransferase involved in cell wall biosynthesis
MFNKFKIIVPSYNCVQWIDKNLSSIESQTYKNYDVCIVDDFSTDNLQREMIKSYCDRNSWKYIFNTNRKYALYNIELGIKESKCEKEDVIILVDGDDWLANDNVLNIVADSYTKEDIHLTYGQYQATDGHTSRDYCFRPDENIIKNKLYRSIPWLSTHLKTFKYSLFKNIRNQHFLDNNGQYFKTASDLAIMFPMIEMAGSKFKCFDEILYTYNLENAISDFRIASTDQARADRLIRSYPKYPTMV